MSYENLSTQDLLLKLEQLEKENALLKQKRKYGLVWEDKQENVVLECESKYPILVEEKRRAILDDTKAGPQNILIEGDNYHALQVLSYTHRGKVDFVYIDPPYNTGAKDWKYNNDYVDSEDSFRHTKWLSMMEKRIILARDTLIEDGIICVTIDDYELPRIWMLLENIFGYENHLGTVVIRNNPKGRMTGRKVSLVHEYGIFFGKSSGSKIKKISENPEDKSHNYKQDSDGTWYLPINLRKQGVDSLAVNNKGKLSDRYYPIYIDPKNNKLSVTKKIGTAIYPLDSNGQKRIWRRGKDAIEDMFNSGDLWFKETKNGFQLYFKFRGGLDGRMVQSIWSGSEFSASEYGTLPLDEILGRREMFQYPKSPYAVKESILAAMSKQNGIVLDFFAGSGTTGHAVMQLNKEDGGNRQYILVTNNENKICEEVTYERLKRVMKGYKNKKGEKVEGLGGNLRYLKCEFVEKTRHTGNMKMRITNACTEMLCLKEGVFEMKEEVTHKGVLYYKIFTGVNATGQVKTFGIYYDLDDEYLDQMREELKALGGEMSAYIFSLAHNPDFINDKRKWKGIDVEEIPEKIIEIYDEIYRTNTRKK